ncbi:leucine-rich repeat domain-containing protein [Rhodopirellula sp. MGV]|uniref:leucine-rich repeat domain-containing protein n=1 Tax=Rhodopirellula sp. MGV TaxID=2023130 RepID=UPI000B973ECA|nr:hypothetical protein [Rhodopirellula sp. MGV]OYP34532.1 hypothetical protein CGZ80_14135 [Rhodopirellula sp. MGV]PNY36752.1 hypothetical protein C2E31_11615 [Rhodopirellula baltica]
MTNAFFKSSCALRVLAPAFLAVFCGSGLINADFGADVVSAGDRMVVPAITIGETSTSPSTDVTPLSNDPCSRVCVGDAAKGIAEWDVPGWANYLKLWSALASDPGNKAIRQCFGLPLGGDGQSLAAIRAARGRSAPDWIGWKPGSYAQVDTPHFQIFSRADREQTTDVAEDLERCYWVWTQAFFPLWEGRLQVARYLGQTDAVSTDELLDGLRLRLSSRKKMRVVLFRDREDYGRTLARLTGGSLQALSQSTGFYSAERRTSFFYPTESSDGTASRRHELVHQLFREATRNGLSGDVAGEQSDFWMVEGIAGYFESLTYGDRVATVGGWDSPRLQFIRHRVFARQEVVPLAALRPDGRDAAQQRGDLAQFYAFAIGYTHWLMDSDDVMARRWLYANLAALYRIPLELPDGLVATDEPNEPERGMVALLRIDNEVIRSNPNDRSIEELCLRGCLVDKTGLATIEKTDQLRWLDLTGLPIDTTTILQVVPKADQLRQLSLEACPVDDSIAAWIAVKSELEELDLSSTVCGDETVSAIGELQKLKTLWLTNTKITDAAVDAFSGLPNLRLLDLRGTAVTAQQIARLRRAHPEWTVNPN